MTFRSAKFSGIALTALISAAALSGCATIDRFRHKDEGPVAVASQGQRISIVAFEQKLEPSKSLKGVGYYLPPVQAVNNWPVASGPGGDLVQNADAAKAFAIAWVKSIGVPTKNVTEVLAQPVSDGRLIYTLDGQARVSAFDVNTGAEVWTRDLNPHYKRDKIGFGGGLALDNGRLYVTSGYRFIKALDAATGKEIWSKNVDTPLHSAPTPGDGLVFVTDVDNQIFAFDQNTGEMTWTYQAIAEPARILKSSPPLVSGDTVYAPFSSGEIVALNSKGEPIWDQVLAQSSRTNALSEIRDIAGRPVLYNGVIYAASHAGVFQAMDAKTGDPKWHLTADSVNSPWIAGDVVFLTTLQGELVCVNRDSGQIYWLKDENAGYVKNGKTLFGNPKKVGKAPIWAGPVMASNRLVMVNSLDEAVAFDPKTGNKLQTLKLPGAAFITPIAVGDKLFVVTDDAKLVAIR
jgi:outer membrane protein assembly factor BamB